MCVCPIVTIHCICSTDLQSLCMEEESESRFHIVATELVQFSKAVYVST